MRMTQYRDYGYLSNGTQLNVPIDTKHNTQVYNATHDGAGNYLPYRNRSFISFSYGGKNIEDFNLIATIDGDFLSKSIYANFSDNVTESDVWDGQFYWSSHYDNNSIDFTLATDGMTENELNEFKKWFAPGMIKELILAENPNRGILARVAEVPEYEMIPFEHPTVVKISGNEYTTSTTLYKGTMHLSLVMDDPFWYAISNLLDAETENGYTTGMWVDANGQSNLILNDKDALKILLEDNIPTSAMLLSADNFVPIQFGGTTIPELNKDQVADGSYVGTAVVGQGHVAFALKSNSASVESACDLAAVDDDEADSSNKYGYFYYAGTAPCYPVINFSLVPELGTNGYLIKPYNTIVSNNNLPKKYNTLTIESKEQQEFYFTTPSIYTGYNQAIHIFNTVGEGTDWPQLKKLLRESIKHAAPRAFAVAVADEVSGSSTSVTSAQMESAVALMQNFLNGGNDTIPASSYMINCKTGKTQGTFIYYKKNNNSYEQMTSVEDVGDMVRSKYLKIDERNYPTADGYISSWTEEHPEYSHRVYCDMPIYNLNIQYRYLYL